MSEAWQALEAAIASLERSVDAAERLKAQRHKKDPGAAVDRIKNHPQNQELHQGLEKVITRMEKLLHALDG